MNLVKEAREKIIGGNFKNWKEEIINKTSKENNSTEE
jgi:hypothetical protein